MPTAILEPWDRHKFTDFSSRQSTSAQGQGPSRLFLLLVRPGFGLCTRASLPPSRTTPRGSLCLSLFL